MSGATRQPNPPRPPMVKCPHCDAPNEADRTFCRSCLLPMSGQANALCPCGKPLHTKHCLANLLGCEPRAVVRMAGSGRWPHHTAQVGVRSAGEYRFTDAMVAFILGAPHWPQNSAADEPKLRPVKATPDVRRSRPSRQAQPAAQAGSNVRRLVAKPRERRTA